VIRIERVRLPSGMNAFARREDGRVVVYVGQGLSARQRRAAIREALRAAPLAGWRALRSPVLLPVLAGSVGLRRAPEGRWVTRALLAAAAVAAAVVISVVAATLLTGEATPRGTTAPPAALQHGGQPAPGSGQAPTTGSAPDRRTGSARGSSPAHSGSAPGQAANGKAGAGAPAPEASGKAATVPAAAPSPQPSGQSASSAPAPSPGPSPSPTASKGTCVYLLGILVCL